MRPDYALALANLADLLCDEGGRDVAKNLYDKALKIEPDNAQVKLNRAMLHFLNGELKRPGGDYGGLAREGLPHPRPPVNTVWRPGRRNRQEASSGAQRAGYRRPDPLRLRHSGPLARARPRAAALSWNASPGCNTVRPLFSRCGRSSPAQLKTQGGIAIADYGWLKAVGGINAATLMGSLPRYLRGRMEDFPKPHRFLVPDAGGNPRAGKPPSALGATGICWRSGKPGGHRSIGYAPLRLGRLPQGHPWHLRVGAV